jgi:hypothetical protein
MGTFSMLKSKGKLIYSDLPKDDLSKFRLVVEIDPEIARYYRSLIPKSISFSIPLHSPHISVVRKEIPTNIDVWGKYNGEIIEFEYDSYIFFGMVYGWLNVHCLRLEDIREELGLTRISDITCPPDKRPVFHTTIINFKGKK